MVIRTRELMDAVAVLTDDRQMRVAMKHSAKGAMICGASTFIGGLLGGPVGMAIGGTIGGVSAWRMSNGQFQSVGHIIRNELTERQRTQLTQHILEAVRAFEVTDLAVLLPLVLNSAPIQTAVLKTVVSFVTNEMRLQIVD